MNLQDSLIRGQAGEVSAGNHVNLQDSPTSSHAGGHALTRPI